MTVIEAVQAKTGRRLIDPTLFRRLAARIVADEEMDTELAERIVDQALAFLGACAVSTERLAPSKLVDIGWHTFILHTKDYRDFCARVAGRFIDHVPNDANPGPVDDGARPALSTTATAVAVREAGFVVDTVLWEDAPTCTQCHGGCSDDPAPNPPTDDD